MSMSILNNISALTAENNLNTTQAALQNTLTQLSSGLKINSGADDAAGLSIANGMNANIAALTQSVQNATNSVGQLQTADGALSQVTSLLNRAVTLATEASSAGMTSSQTGALNTEFQSIVSSINNIGKNTNFNGANVFNSAAVTPFLSDGTSGNDLLGTTTVTVGALSAGATGLNITQGADAANTLTLGTTNLSAGNALNIGGTMYTLQTGAPTAAGQVQLGSTANATLQNIANAVNGADGVNSVNANVTAGTVDGGTGALTFNATANGAAGDLLSATSGSVTGTWGATTGTMTGGAAATYDSLTEAMTALPAAGNTVVVGGQTYQFETTVTNAGDVLIGGSTSATLQNLAAAIDAPAGGAATANYRAAAAAPTVSANAVGSTVTFTANASGVSGLTLTTTGTAFGGAALTGVALAGGAVAATAKGTLTLSSNLVAGSTLTVGSQTYTLVNGTTATAGQIALGATPSTANTNAAIVKAVNGTDGVNSVNADAVASLAAGVLTFTATTAGAVGNTYAATGGLIAANTSVGSWSSTGGTLTGGDGPTVTANLDTVANAQAALVTVTNAINTVAETRGSLGAVINQLTAASNVMNGQVQNLTSAQSGIMDANIGTTVANMSKYNTLQQTGIAALQQANQASQSILKLLQ